jgi:SM-20-related protein
MSPMDVLLETVCDGLAGPGYAVVPRALPPELCEAARAEIEAARSEGKFRAAVVGRADGRRLESEVRRDGILWFEPDALTPVQGRIWSFLDEMRAGLNRTLQLGLWDLEGHYAIYPPGAFYRRHLDRFPDAGAVPDGTPKRTVSAVLYFNPGWNASDGGLLALDLPEGRVEVAPEAGTAVFFLSDRIAHEVTESTRERMSFAGWFRRRQRT